MTILSVWVIVFLLVGLGFFVERGVKALESINDRLAKQDVHAEIERLKNN